MSTLTWIILTVIIVIMRKRILRFLRKVFGWEKAREFKDKPKVPVEPEVPEPPKEKVVEIKVSGEGDQTDFIQSQINALGSGTSEEPLVIKFPEGKIWTEGNRDRIGIGKPSAIIYFNNLSHFRVEGGHFYTIAPFTPYGGSVQNNDYSHRRHIKFHNCTDFSIKETVVEGSNLIKGRLIGTTPELTPEFWKGGEDDGSVGNAPAYKSYWELEHAFDFLGCKRFVVENVKVNGVWGDGVCIGHSNEDFEVKNSHLRLTGRQGVAVYNSKRGVIDTVFVDDGRRAAIDLEPDLDGGYVLDVEIKNCKLHSMQVPIAGLGKGRVDDIYIHDNEYSGGNFIVCGDSSRRTRRKNWKVINNTRIDSFGSPSASVKFYMVDDVIFENNTDIIGSTQSKRTLQLEDCTNVNVINNEFGSGEFIVQTRTTGTIAEDNTPKQIIKEY